MARPKWDMNETIRGAVAICDLAKEHRSVLEPRLDAGRIDGLEADLVSLRGDSAKVASTIQTKLSATQAQDKLMAKGAGIVSAIRAAVRCSHPHDRDSQKRFGIGRKVGVTSVDSVSSALQMVLDAAEAKPEVVRAAGILPADLDEARATHAALAGADNFQETKKVGAVRARVQRDATQVRVETAMDRIYGAAALVFREQPEILAQFDAAIPAKKNRRKPKTTNPEPTPA